MSVNIGPKIGIDGEAEFRREINGLIQQQKTLASEMKAVTSAFDANDRSQESLTAQSKVLNKQIEVQKERIRLLEKGLEEATRAFGETDTKTLKWKQALNEATTDLNKMQGQLNNLESSIDDVGETLDNSSQDVVSFGDALKANLLSKAIIESVKQLANSLKEAFSFIVSAGSDFEAAMSEVAAISGASQSEIEALTQKAKEMGRTTIFSASEAAEAMKYMAMAGWDTQEAIDGLDGVMNLAAASGENLATASDIVTDALTAFGMTANEASKFSDILAATANSASTDVSLMGETFKYIAPVAGVLGYSVEDVAVAIGLMANSGIKGSDAGTALRAALTRMIQPSKSAKNALKELGLYTKGVNTAIVNSDGTAKSFSETIRILREKFSELSEVEQTQAATSIFGKEAMSGMLAIITSSESDFDALSETMNSATGTAEKMADIMTDNLKGSITTAKSALEGLSLEIYNTFSEDAKNLINAFSKKISELTKSVDWEDFSKKIKEFIKLIVENGDYIISVVAGIGAGFLTWNVATMVMTAVTQIKSFAMAIKSGNTVMQALNLTLNANPFALIVTAIATVTTVLITLWNTNEDFRNAVIGIWDKIKQVFSDAWEFIKQVWDTVYPYFKQIWDGIYDVIQSAIDAIKSILEFLVEIGKQVAEKLSEFFSWAWESIKAVWDTVKPYFDAIWGFIKDVFSVVAPVIGGFFSAAWNAVVAVWNTVTGYFQNIFNTIAGIFDGATALFKGDFEGAWNAIVDVLSGWGDFFQGLFDDIFNIFSKIGEVFYNVGKNIIDSIKNGIKSVWDNLVNWWNDIWDNAFGKKTINVDVVKNERTVSAPVSSSSKKQRTTRVFPENPIMRAKDSLLTTYQAIAPAAEYLTTQMQQSRYRAETAMMTAANFLPEQKQTKSKSPKNNPSVNLGGVTIVINPRPDMDENAIANRVAQILEQMTRQKEALWG